MKKFKALLINPTAKTVELVEITKDYKSIGALVDDTICGVGYIQKNGKVGSDFDDFIYCGDNSMFDSTADFSYIKGYGQQVYRGNLVITGSDGEGGTADVKMTVDEAKSLFVPVSKYAVRALVANLDID